VQYLLKELGPETINTMKMIKRALDPYNLMNPVRQNKMLDWITLLIQGRVKCSTYEWEGLEGTRVC